MDALKKSHSEELAKLNAESKAEKEKHVAELTIKVKEQKERDSYYMQAAQSMID